jgi:hypothetical protein
LKDWKNINRIFSGSGCQRENNAPIKFGTPLDEMVSGFAPPQPLMEPFSMARNGMKAKVSGKRRLAAPQSETARAL